MVSKKDKRGNIDSKKKANNVRQHLKTLEERIRNREPLDRLDNKTYYSILMSGMEIFSEKGYKGTSLDEIASKAGLTKGAIYWNFKNKLELYNAIDNYVLTKLDKAVLESISNATDCRSRIKILIRRTIEFYEENPKMFDFMMKVYEGPLTFRSMMTEKLAREYAFDRELLAEIISEGVKKGEFKRVNPETCALVLEGIIDGVVMQWSIDREGIDLNLAISEIIKIVFDGIEQRNGRIR